MECGGGKTLLRLKVYPYSVAVEQFLTIRRTVNLDLHLNGITPFLKKIEPGLCSVKTLAFGGNPCGSVLPLMPEGAYLLIKEIWYPGVLLRARVQRVHIVTLPSASKPG